MKREIKFRFWDIDLGKMCFRHPAKMDFSHPKIAPMQFTGLRDQNGVEIYEGDIVKDLNNATYQIFSVKGGFGFTITAFGIKSKCPYNSLSDEQNVSWMESNCELLGNIHENPELLN